MTDPAGPPIVMCGWLGWGNRKPGLEAYGPGGRWGGGPDGDLLGDALQGHGGYEGMDLVVVAFHRFHDKAVIEEIQQVVAERLGVEVVPLEFS